MIARPATGEVKIIDATIPRNNNKKINAEVTEVASDLILFLLRINTKLLAKLLTDLLRSKIYDDGFFKKETPFLISQKNRLSFLFPSLLIADFEIFRICMYS